MPQATSFLHDRFNLFVVNVSSVNLPSPDTTPTRPIASKRCPVCSRGFGAEAQFCAWDATSLVSSEDDDIGVLIADRYRTERRLGQGGMGAVWLAIDTRLGRRVALKRILNATVATVEERARFKREANNASLLDHPNVVRVIDLLVSETDPVLVLEFVPGLTLSEILRSHGALPSEVVSTIVRDLAEGLSAVHALGFIHRDLKPSNVMVTGVESQSLRIKILDFGLARSFNDPSQDVTAPGFKVGTAMYMSPEQLRGTGIDSRSDVFALAAVACTMLAGRIEPPEFAVPISTRNVQVQGWPASLIDVLSKGLDHDASKRYRTPILFASALHAALKDVDHTLFVLNAPGADAQSLQLPTTRSVQ